MPRRTSSDIRCVYTDGRRRCRRDGQGDPPICPAHKIAFAEAARATGKQRGDALGDLFERVITGRRVSKKMRQAAWADVENIIADALPNNRHFHPPPNWQPPPGWVPRPSSAPPPPREDPAVVEFKAAKRLLGFPESQPITADDVAARRKELARKYHPDRPGGSTEKMQKINAACDVLLRGAA